MYTSNFNVQLIVILGGIYTKKRKFIIIIMLVIGCVAISVFQSAMHKDNLRKNIYDYLMNKNNRIVSYMDGVRLNNGSSANTCVYFVSDVLRKNRVKVPDSVSNTSQLLSYLKKNGWRKDFDYKDLKSGDLCFTTDEKGNKNGIPTHTYIFMKWMKEGSYEYAYVCDNQSKDYENKIYHIRNIKNSDSKNGYDKDAFAFFMK